ncbi:MAG TPA: hypothetical protein VGS21_12625, partial [Acidimicrobiales bacterium]|nr:hypothetical protein [Acidimicrobiales bacterium]
MAGRRSTSMVQRALAQAYYVRGGQSWRQLDQAELKRIVELAGRNLARAGCKEEDYRLWFEAYKLLRGFDLDEALSQLRLWSGRFPSWRAHYYLSCLYFHLWFTGRSNDYEAYRAEQQKSEKYAVGRTKRSYLWLSQGPQWFPMIADGDLGEWNRSKNFWKSTSQLQRVNGVIEFMRKPQAGEITLAGPATAFFVPSLGGFLPGSDENTPVNFFLGLSPEGPRAWDVKPGHVASALDARRSVPAPEPAVPLVERERVEVAPGPMAVRAAEINRQQRLDFCLALLEAWRTVGDTPLLSRLKERLQARFRYDGSDILLVLAGSKRIYVDTAHEDPLVELDGSTGGRPFVVDGPRLGRMTYANDVERHGVIELVGAVEGRARLSFEDIRAYPPGQPYPIRGQIVRIEAMDLGRNGGMDARGVELLPRMDSLVGDEIVPADQLRARVLAEVRVFLEDRLAADQSQVAAREVEDALEVKFAGCLPLSERLGTPSLALLWRDVNWLQSSGGGAKRTLRLRDGKVFGRTAEPRQQGKAPHEQPEDRFGQALARVVGELERTYGRSPKYWRVNQALRKDLGDTYDEVVGKSLK